MRVATWNINNVVRRLDLVLDWLAAVYANRSRPDDAAFASRACAEAAVNAARTSDAARASRAWWQASEAYRRLGDPARQCEALRSALESDFANYNAHRALGMLLSQNEQYEEAREHLNWCARRRPDDTGVLTLLEQTVESQIRAPTSTAETPRPRMK